MLRTKSSPAEVLLTMRSKMGCQLPPLLSHHCMRLQSSQRQLSAERSRQLS